ncbi:VacJ family lipoprotein [Aestuariirhabdus sp. Z084]|uniref:MlaA family lipoprotein n=1 Tax=Aestuariirhabdus haliotis TaxID=2918751 RepID=UPI00201B423A|nr:VacJ family lipoprotein [Aestuariirhabdus haliotis]MCL6414634.1 VacJ family lipoprotein [Aestuariirhabdus haliotis]MCL6418384.1 VacJ family lipoprotein [Aestuariirhabdus haliotis]
MFRVLGAFGLVVLLLFPGAATAEGVDDPDPWEPMNRKIFQFNEGFDKYLLKPVAEGYVAGVPEPMRGLASTFYSTSFAPADGVNLILQGEPVRGIQQISRFLINCVLGMLCTVDVADSFGIQAESSNLGTTLGKWGVADGPYLVVPFLGPHTLRDAATIYPSSLMWTVNYVEPWQRRTVLQAGMVVEKRASLLKAEELIIGDKYSFIRDAYLQTRQFEITGEEPEDDF